GGHAGGGAGEIGDQSVVVTSPEEDGGGVGVNGEGGLRPVLTEAEAGEAEDELGDDLLRSGGNDDGGGVLDVVEVGTRDGEVGDLCGEVVAAGGDAGRGDGDGRRAGRLKEQGVGGSGIGDERLHDGE